MTRRILYGLNNYLRPMLFVLTLAILLSVAKAVKAQTAFLLSPYYGSTVVNQGYSTGHPAYDYNLSYTQVLAADAGTVILVKWFDDSPECHGPVDNPVCGYGLHIYIRHSNNYVSRYGHLSSTAFALGTTTASVASGQFIGTSGNTGWSTGPHLHFEVRDQNGAAVDPNNPSLWKDGRWANPSRPIPAPVNGGEIVVNDTTNNTGGFSKGSGGHFNNPCTGDCGGWLRNSNMYGAFVNGGIEDSWASWTATGAPSEGGVYEVFVFIPNVAVDTTTWQASYAVIHTEGTSSGVLDQMGSRGRWISIGAYRMSSGSAIVYVTDVGEAQGVHCGTGQYCRLGADAVKFVRRGTTYAPDVRYNNGGWSSTATLRINGGFLTGIVIQNLGSAATGVVVVYCDRPYTSCQTATVTNNLAPLRAYGYNLNSEALLPSGWTGSITISSSNGATPLAVSINNLKNFGNYQATPS